MPFSSKIKEEVLVRSKRCCCVCQEFAGRDLNVHHIIQEADGGLNTLENAIVLCLRCHSEAGHYNDRHPIGTKFSPSELKRHRDNWWNNIRTHPDFEIVTKYRPIYQSQELHTYELFVQLNNLSKLHIDSWKFAFQFPADIPVRTQNINMSNEAFICNIIYRYFEFESNKAIFPGQIIQLIGSEIIKVEYDINIKGYFHPNSHLWKFIWQFYSNITVPIIGEKPWKEMHQF